MKMMLTLKNINIFVRVLLLVIIIFFFLTLFSATQAIVVGDINDDGSIDILDVVLISKYILGLTGLDEEQRESADVNADGRVNQNDLNLIVKKVLGIIDDFKEPPESPADNIYNDDFISPADYIYNDKADDPPTVIYGAD